MILLRHLISAEKPRALARAAFACLAICAGAHAAPASVYLEELTSAEVRDALNAGKTTIIIPVGGTEQSGPHIALGKHNVRARVLAGRIAQALGNTLVAPVIAYVPEGNIAPPSGHMRFAGTISIPDDAFKGMLEGAGRSFKQQGFTDVVLIGDHGGYQGQLKAIAARLNHEWAGTPARADFVAEYYLATQAPYAQVLRAKGLTDAEIGTHAGVADTSLMLAVNPALVRAEQLPAAARAGLAGGVAGDPRGSSAALGQLGVDLIVEKSVAAIRRAQGTRR
jgi:creatinine amidohydrolase